MTAEEEAADLEAWRRQRDSDALIGLGVIEQIADAFAGVERGDGVSLHEADVIDDHGSAAERAAARRKDTDTHWQDVPGPDIERYNWILSFLDAKGFRYYAPAYMAWTIRNMDTSDSMSTDSTIYSFCFLDSTFREYHLQRWSLFDAAQRGAIYAFLHFMAYHSHGRADENTARDALADYWGRFGAS